MSENKNILLIEDDRTTQKLLEKHIVDAGFQCTVVDMETEYSNFCSHVSALVKDNNIHVVICDLTIPGVSKDASVMNGITVIKSVVSDTQAHVLALSGTVDQQALDKLRIFKVKGSFSKDLPNVYQAVVEELKKLEEVPRRKLKKVMVY